MAHSKGLFITEAIWPRYMPLALLSERGMDLYNAMTLYYADGRVANLQSSALSHDNRQGVISGTEGFMVVNNVNSPEGIHNLGSLFPWIIEKNITYGLLGYSSLYRKFNSIT